jgi:hypothetical protein
MGLDPNILLQTTNINAEAAKQTAIATQAAAQAGQLRLQQYTIQKAKSDFEDQQNLKQAWRAAGGDPTKTLATAAAMGVSPKAIQAFQMQQMAIQEKLDTHNKIVADTGKTNLDTYQERSNLEYTALKPLLDSKDDVEFQSKKPQVIAALKSSGLASDDEIKLLSGATQQQVQDHATGLLNVDALAKIVKGKTDQQGADAKTSEAATAAQKQANESAAQIADSQQKFSNGASTSLSGVLQANGAVKGQPLPVTAIVAYGKQLDKIKSDNPKMDLSGMPSPQSLTQYKTSDDALTAVTRAGMTSAQQNQADQADRTAANTAAYQKQEIALRQQSTQIQQAMLGLDVKKTAAAMFSAGLDNNGKPLPGQAADLLRIHSQNTSDGKLYIDQDTAYKGLPKGEQVQLQRAAGAAGIPLLNGKEAASVKDVDTARNTINQVFDTFLQHAGVRGTGTATGVGNWLSIKTGGLPDLNAARSNFLSSIEAMKSAGGQGSGLRITGAEINKIGSMMPALTDTQDQLKTKLAQFNTLVNDKMNGALHSVPVTGAAASVPSNGPKVGYTEQGYRYKGGDPADKNNWEQVK